MNLNITLQPSGRTFATERDETILSAAIRASIGMPYGCKDGACGTCKSRLLEGRVIHGAHQSKALSDQEESDGFILPCCATPQTDCVVEARAVPGAGDFPVLKMPCRLITMGRPSNDVAVLKLQLAANQSFGYRAGQYVEFILRDGARRSYSMANAPHTLGTPAAIELHIRHMPGGKFTDHVFGALKEKDILRMEGPFGSFFLRQDSEKPIILLASGTGFAPIKAIIEQLAHLQTKRDVTLYWGARVQADLYMHDWVLQQAAQMPNLHYVPVLSEAKPEHGWAGRMGFVHQAVMQDFADMSGYQVYACGVPVMVESAQRDFIASCQLPVDEFYSDAFISEADKHPKQALV